MTTIDISNFEYTKKYKIIYLNPQSQYSLTQIEKLNSKKVQFLDLDVDLLLCSDPKQLDLSSGDKSNHQILILNQENQLIWQGLNLNFKDLSQVCLDFFSNYYEDTSGKDIFKWGNKITTNGDFMCNDCGFILSIDDSSEYKIGMAFPVCDVCQAGEPEGPSGSNEAFWQKI